jgi:hypothetical protein
MRNFLFLVLVVICAVTPVFAQTELSLKQYFEGISYRYVAGDSRKPRVIRVGPPTTFVKEGLRTEEVLRLLGKPVATSERVEQGLVVTTYEFLRGGGRVLVADFVSDALVHSRIETRGKSMQADGLNF